MRASLLLGVLAAGCLESGAPPIDDEVDPVELQDGVTSPRVGSMVTWNLKTFPLSSQTPGTVAEVLEHWQDDLIAVQEIMDVDAFNEMVDSMPSYEGLLNDDPGGYMRVGLLYNTDRVTIDSVETLFQHDSYAFPRPPLTVHATIDLEESGPIDFHVVVVHLKSQVGSGTQERRAAAAEKLQEWVTNARSAFDDKDIVILGDWNQEVVVPIDHSEWAPFLERPDEYEFLTYDDNSEGGYTQIGHQSFLDHVLVTTDALDEYGTGETLVVDLRAAIFRYEQSLSDHLPVRATFVPTAPPHRDAP